MRSLRKTSLIALIATAAAAYPVAVVPAGAATPDHTVTPSQPCPG